MKSRVVTWLALGLILVGAAAIRLRLLDLPLDRDEGEYAYFGQLLLEGVPPYAAAYNLKAPGIYVAYALILAVFGHTTTGIHLGLIVVTSVATVLMFVLARSLAGPTAGGIAPYPVTELGDGEQVPFGDVPLTARTEQSALLPAAACAAPRPPRSTTPRSARAPTSCSPARAASRSTRRTSRTTGSRSRQSSGAKRRHD